MSALDIAIEDLTILRVRLSKKNIPEKEIIRNLTKVMENLRNIKEEQIVRSKIQEVYNMPVDRIESFRARVSMSSMSTKGKNLIYKACDDRLQSTQRADATVITSDVDDFADL